MDEEEKREKGCALLSVRHLRHPVTAARTVFRKYRMKYEDRGKRIEAGFYYARPRISSFVHRRFERLFLDDSIFFSTLFHVKGGGGRKTGRQTEAARSLSFRPLWFDIGLNFVNRAPFKIGCFCRRAVVNFS